jgi:RNA polymerase sigma-70 factor (ECF subfamily)
MQSSDEELVARVLATRDQKAFAELVRRHQSRVRGWLRRLSGSASAGDDLAQETFMTAWDKLHTYGGRGRFGGWVMTIAYREFLQAHRNRQRHERLTAAVAVEAGEPAVHDPAGPESAATDLQRMLAILSDEERAAMILCYAHGMSHGEASEVTGMPIGTIKSHIHRAKERIRARFLSGETHHA